VEGLNRGRLIQRCILGSCLLKGRRGNPWGRDIKDGFIFHDIRHTFVTNMRKAGVSKSVRMSITGHAPKDMDDRYNRVDLQDQHEAIKKLEVFLAKVDPEVIEIR